METAKSLQQQAYEHLKDLIYQDFFSYDQIYSETKVAKEMGISRTPMRDAIHRLSQEHFLDIIPSKGFCLHQMNRQDIQETFQVRSAIEGYCTYLITKDFKLERAASLFAQLRKNLDQQKEILLSSKSVKAFVSIDNAFHLAIVQYSDNHTLYDLFQSFLYRIQRLATLSLSHEGRMKETIQEHEDILCAMEQGHINDIYSITMLHMEKPKGLNLDDIRQ